MASLMHLLETEKIASERTERLYFGKYSYRITLDVTLLDGINKSRKRALKKGEPLEELSDTLVSLLPLSDTKRVFTIKRMLLEKISQMTTRREWNDCLRLYIRDEDDAKYIISFLRPLVCDVKCPQNEKQASLLLEDHKVVIRKSLYWGRFRWLVEINWRFRDDALRDWCDNTFGFTSFKSNDRAMMTDYPMRLFLKSESDVFLFKIAFSDAIQKISKVILPEETDDSATTPE